MPVVGPLGGEPGLEADMLSGKSSVCGGRSSPEIEDESGDDASRPGDGEGDHGGL